MKKIALLLSLVMVLSCLFVMASCGEEETSTPAESTAESAAESAAESKEEPAASSEEAPAESSEEPVSEEPSEEPVESTDPAESGEPAEYKVGDPQLFWVSHYNDGFVEGSGVIFTEEDTAGGWWLHVAFAPVAGTENIYEITAITNGLADGSASTVALPDGGFVWAANYGNDYPTLYPDDPTAINFVNDNCTSAIEAAKNWTVGDKFQISGVDFENIPTTTPDANWYDASYVCTATIAPVQ